MDLALKLKRTLDQQHDLLTGCVRGERTHQKRLYQLYHGKMLSVCMRYTSNHEEAKDILHEGFMKVFKNIHHYKPQHSLESWIRRIMINTAIDHYRKNKKFKNQVNLEYAAHQPAPDTRNIVHELSAEEILKLVQQLSPAYRTVFNLYIIEGYNHREVGEMLGISEGTSKSNLAKARGKLRVMLKEKLNYEHFR